MATLLVGYDGSEGAEAALHEGLRLAQLMDAEVVLAYGVQVPRVGGEVSDHAAAVREAGERQLEHGRSRAAGAGARVRTQLVEGRIAEGLAELATTEEAELIVVGSRGEAPLRGLLLGSTPYRLLHLARVPVLVVPA